MIATKTGVNKDSSSYELQSYSSLPKEIRDELSQRDIHLNVYFVDPKTFLFSSKEWIDPTKPWLGSAAISYMNELLTLYSLPLDVIEYLRDYKKASIGFYTARETTEGKLSELIFQLQGI